MLIECILKKLDQEWNFNGDQYITSELLKISQKFFLRHGLPEFANVSFEHVILKRVVALKFLKDKEYLKTKVNSVGNFFDDNFLLFAELEASKIFFYDRSWPINNTVFRLSNGYDVNQTSALFFFKITASLRVLVLFLLASLSQFLFSIRCSKNYLEDDFKFDGNVIIARNALHVSTILNLDDISSGTLILYFGQTRLSKNLLRELKANNLNIKYITPKIFTVFKINILLLLKFFSLFFVENQKIEYQGQPIHLKTVTLELLSYKLLTDNYAACIESELRKLAGALKVKTFELKSPYAFVDCKILKILGIDHQIFCFFDCPLRRLPQANMYSKVWFKTRGLAQKISQLNIFDVELNQVIPIKKIAPSGNDSCSKIKVLLVGHSDSSINENFVKAIKTLKFFDAVEFYYQPHPRANTAVFSDFVPCSRDDLFSFDLYAVTDSSIVVDLLLKEKPFFFVGEADTPTSIEVLHDFKPVIVQENSQIIYKALREQFEERLNFWRGEHAN